MLNGLIFPDDCMHSSLCVLTTAWIPLYFPRPSINTCPTQLFQNFSFPLKPPTPTLPSYSQLHSLLTHVVIQPVGKLKQFQEKLPQVLTLHLVPYHSLWLLYSVFLPITLNDLSWVSIYIDYVLMHGKCTTTTHPQVWWLTTINMNDLTVSVGQELSHLAG